MDGARELGWDQVREAKFISDPKSKHGMDNRDKVQSLEGRTRPGHHRSTENSQVREGPHQEAGGKVF